MLKLKRNITVPVGLYFIDLIIPIALMVIVILAIAQLLTLNYFLMILLGFSIMGIFIFLIFFIINMFSHLFIKKYIEVHRDKIVCDKKEIRFVDISLLDFDKGMISRGGSTPALLNIF